MVLFVIVLGYGNRHMWLFSTPTRCRFAAAILQEPLAPMSARKFLPVL